MKIDSRKPKDVTQRSAEAAGMAEFAEFAATMKRAGVDWEPVASPPGRIARGTTPPDPVTAPGVELDDEFHDAITRELPVMTLPTAQYQDWHMETVSEFEPHEYETPWSRRRRNLGRLFTWAVALLLLTVAGAVWWATRADRPAPPTEPERRPIAPVSVGLPEIVVELDSPMSLIFEPELVVATPPAGDGE